MPNVVKQDFMVTENFAMQVTNLDAKVYLYLSGDHGASVDVKVWQNNATEPMEASYTADRSLLSFETLDQISIRTPAAHSSFEAILIQVDVEDGVIPCIFTFAVLAGQKHTIHLAPQNTSVAIFTTGEKGHLFVDNNIVHRIDENNADAVVTGEGRGTSYAISTDGGEGIIRGVGLAFNGIDATGVRGPLLNKEYVEN